MNKVLSFGLAKDLLANRHETLAKYDFEVWSVGSREAALDLIRSEQFGALIIGHLVPQPVRDEIATVAKSMHQARVIFLYRGSIANAELADAVLNADGPPELLAETVASFIRYGSHTDAAAAQAS